MPQKGEESVGQTYSFNLQANDNEVITDPVYRVVVDVSFGSLLGAFQSGYYVNAGDGVYFVSKKAIQVATSEQVSKVFAFLAKTKIPFTISIRHSETLSGHQYVEGEVTLNHSPQASEHLKLPDGVERCVITDLSLNILVAAQGFTVPDAYCCQDFEYAQP